MPAIAAEVTFYPGAERRWKRIACSSSILRSTRRLPEPMINGFQKANPDVAVRYEDLLTDRHLRPRRHRDRRRAPAPPTSPFPRPWTCRSSSPMTAMPRKADLPLCGPLAALGQLARHRLCADLRAGGLRLPQAELQGRAAAGDTRPVRRFPQGRATRSMAASPPTTSSAPASASCSWRATRSSIRDIWSVIRAMGAAGVKLYSTSSAILERIADGRFVLGYNILGSYAADWAATQPRCRHRAARRTTRW